MKNLITLKLKSIPTQPGVYFFKNKSGEVIYIGKAKNLKNRVNQYFKGTDTRVQIPFLINEATDLDYTVVHTELESLYLERTLIQNHKPKYNIELKDDKSYAFIVLDYSTQIPQINITRRIQEPLLRQGFGGQADIKYKANSRSKITNNKSDYFGPYTSALKIRETLQTVRRIFPYCSAEKVSQKPCFYYHLHRCPGVCFGKISLDEYKTHLERIKQFLSGNIAGAMHDLKKEMLSAAKKKRFETAARLRNQFLSLKLLSEKQSVIFANKVNWDLASFSSDEGFYCVNLLKVREGKLVGKENFVYDSKQTKENESNKEQVILETFLEQYYLETSDIPKEIYLNLPVSNVEVVKNLLKARFGKSVKISVPKKGKALSLLKTSALNAKEHLKNWLTERAGHLDKIGRALKQLQEVLGLKKIPERIECFDISNTQGTNPVASMVVFKNGLAAKSEYRKFKVQIKETPDDFSMMREIITRRLTHSLISRSANQPDQLSKWPLPDLIVVDGGKGQLNAALAALSKLKVAHSTSSGQESEKLKVIGLAKRLEEIFVPGKKQPIILSHDQPALQLLQRLRDEAHRFGITFHRNLRSKQAYTSALDTLPGVGPKTKKILKTKFGTVAEIKKASLEELKAVVGEKLALTIKQNL